MRRLTDFHRFLGCICVPLIASLAIGTGTNNEVTTRSSDERCGRKVVAYYTSWTEKEVTKEMFSYVTHIIYSFPDMSSDGNLSFSEPASNRLHNLVKLRGSDSHPKLLVAIGGWMNRFYFDNIARNGGAFAAFMQNLKKMLIDYNLDGVDMDWEFPGVYPDDRTLFILFMRKIRTNLERWSAELERPRYLLTFAGPAWGDAELNGFDLQRLFATDDIDWVNVMTYDYFVPWANDTKGRNTGPPAPLFAHGPPSYSKLNAHWSMEYYACAIKNLSKIVIGIPLYGRYWTDVNPTPIDNIDPIWRRRDEDLLVGNDIRFNALKNHLDSGFKIEYNDKVHSSYAWNDVKKTYIGYESPQSASAKVDYAVVAKLGGVMMWAVDYDDENLSMLKAITNEDICAARSSAANFVVPQYRCYEPRWWSWSKGTEDKFGLCGVNAPLINGYYPVCDSLDSLHSCCGAEGTCGTGKEFCECPKCVDYGKHPEKILEQSVQPSLKQVLWYTSENQKYFGKCGPKVPRINGTVAICNPDDPNAHCCSPDGLCGTGKEFCSCNGCVDLKINPKFRFSEKAASKGNWWTWETGPASVGRCGPLAPRIDGEVAICDPDSSTGPCCSKSGYCGSGEKFCDCQGCVDHRIY